MALKTSLISYWKLGEASGTRVDSHGSNDLTDNNTVLSAAGILGDAADFEYANSEYLNHTDNTDLSTGDIDFTFACWIKAETLPGSTVFACKGGFGALEWFLDCNNGTNIRFVISGLQTVTSTGTISTGNWYFVVAWHDATANTINLQINDGSVDTLSSVTGPTDGAGDFYLGFLGDFGMYWDGLIDEAAFWKRTLTSGERTEIYNSGAGLSYDDWDVVSGQPTIRRFGGIQFTSSNLVQGITRW